MTTSIEQALRSGAVRLVPVEATGAMLQAVITANRAETGLLIPISFECAAGKMAYNAMLSAAPDYTPDLVALVETLKGQAELATEVLKKEWVSHRETLDRALAAEAEVARLKARIADLEERHYAD